MVRKQTLKGKHPFFYLRSNSHKILYTTRCLLQHPVTRRPFLTRLPIMAQLTFAAELFLLVLAATGTSAPQVYKPKCVVVYHLPAARIPEYLDLEPIPWTTMVNPEITPVT